MTDAKGTDRRTIFIQIASYRDDELPRTIESCLKNATHPDCLSFGIVHQYDAVTKNLIDEYKQNTHFRIVEMPWEEARGVGAARAECNLLYKDETFMLQIDSHMRFDKGWDEQVIRQWYMCDDAHAVLSTYPPAYKYDESGKEYKVSYFPTMLAVYKFADGDIPLFEAKEFRESIQQPHRACFVSGGFTFGPGGICREVPYVKDICFTGEEVVYSLRLFTFGYRVYSPVKLPVYHLYTRQHAHKYWQDMGQSKVAEHRSIYEKMISKSYQTMRKILSNEATLYFGSDATLKEFENYAGISFSLKLVHPSQEKRLEPPYAYSSSWSDLYFPVRQWKISLDLSSALENGQEVEMVRVKLIDKYQIKVYQRDISWKMEDRVEKIKITLLSRTKPESCTILAYDTKTGWSKGVNKSLTL